MARFFVPMELWKSGEFPEAEARHASQVLRLTAGTQVEIFDGTGRVARAKLTAVSKRAVKVEILHERCEVRPRPEIHLIVALLKNERFDWLIQKATELGAASIRPVSAQRSVVKMESVDAEKRHAKWVQVSIEAAKQCGHVVLPKIFPIASLSEAVRSAPEGLKGIPTIDAQGMTLQNFFGDSPSNVTFGIGPEGDWTSEEMASAQEAGFLPLHLGRHILRSETAALHVLSAAAHHFLDGVGGIRALS